MRLPKKYPPPVGTLEPTSLTKAASGLVEKGRYDP